MKRSEVVQRLADSIIRHLSAKDNMTEMASDVLTELETLNMFCLENAKVEKTEDDILITFKWEDEDEPRSGAV